MDLVAESTSEDAKRLRPLYSHYAAMPLDTWGLHIRPFLRPEALEKRPRRGERELTSPFGSIWA